MPAAVDHILPHQNALHIAVMIPKKRLHFNVLAQHIKAAALYMGHIVRHSCIGRWGQKAVRVIPLVQQTVMEIRLIVQKQTGQTVQVPTDRELAHTEIGTDHLAAGLKFHLIEKRRLRAPGLKIRQRHICVRRVGDQSLAVINTGAHMVGAKEFKVHGGAVIIRRDPHFLQEFHRRGLQPNALPNAALGRIPNTATLGLLFSPGILVFVRKVLHRYFQLVLPRLQGLSQLQSKRCVAPLMAAHLHTV